MDKDHAKEFALDWIDSWNSHDIERILDHYTEEFEMNSPVIVKRMNVANGKLVGKHLVGEYWSSALMAYPTLKFDLINVFCGVNSLTILYMSSVGGQAAETFVFDDKGKVKVAYAAYA